MIKVAIIGAGSLGFTRGIVRDILSVPEFRDNTDVRLTDISRRNLSMVYRLVKRDMESNGVKSVISATTDRRQALKGANYVFSVVRVGGLEGFQTDIDIPLKYGVDQCVGDTLCAGGVMYAQRTIPVLLDFCKDISEVAAPGCKFINHSNPLAMNTWACSQYGDGVETIGLCHGVEGGHWQIANVLGLKREEVDIVCAGINHLSWYIKVGHRGQDMTGKLLKAFEEHPTYSRTEKVRIDLMRRFGYYCTESNGHCSEYVAWYRKRAGDILNWIDLSSWINGETGGYLRVCTEGRNWFETDFPQWLQQKPWVYGPDKRGGEHGSYIVEGLETGRVYRGHFNVVNHDRITNLPSDCVIEAPGYVDRNGLTVPWIGDIPAGCAAACNSNVTVQRLSVEAAVHGDDTLLRQAMMMDPLTGAVCNPPEIWQMTDELLVAQARWLPQYRAAIAAARRRRARGKLIPTRTSKGAARLHTRTVKEMARDAAKARARAAASDKAAMDREASARKR